MRILLIAPQPFYEDRGTPIAIREILEALSDLGFIVDVATYPVGTNIEIPTIKLIRTTNPFNYRSISIGLSFRKIVLNLFLTFTVLRLVYRNDYNCIHAVEESASIALLCKMLFRLPVIYDMHSDFVDQITLLKGIILLCLWKMLASRLEKLLIKYSDCVVCSRGLASYVLSFEPNKKVWECFFNGDKTIQRKEHLASSPTTTNFSTVVYCGTFAKYQGLETLIEAASLVCREIPEVKFILVGGTETEISRLNRIIIKNGLETTIKLISRRPREEVPYYLSLADGLVLPRLTGKNAPLKIFEYIRSCKPIVATDIAAHRTMLSDKASILVAPEPEALAKGISRAFQEGERIKKNAQAAIVSGYLPKKPLKQTMEEVYQFITNKGQ